MNTKQNFKKKKKNKKLAKNIILDKIIWHIVHLHPGDFENSIEFSFFLSKLLQMEQKSIYFFHFL
jgi:hypothetical protein